jgi:hypothetical protein
MGRSTLARVVFASLGRLQLLDLLRNFAASPDQVGDEPVVDVEDAFVLSPIPHVVALRQDSPDLRAQAKSVR